MSLSKQVLGLIFGGAVGWMVGASLESSSACILGEFSVVGGAGSPFFFCTLPIVLVFALIGWWVGKKIEHDEPLLGF